MHPALWLKSTARPGGFTTRRTISISGCPEYSPYGQKTPNTPVYTNKQYKVRANPVIASSPTW